MLTAHNCPTHPLIYFFDFIAVFSTLAPLQIQTNTTKMPIYYKAPTVSNLIIGFKQDTILFFSESIHDRDSCVLCCGEGFGEEEG